MANNEIVLFTGSANPVLAQEISEYLKIPLTKGKVMKFSDGEIQLEIHENVRNRDVFIIQSTCRPVNDNLMELLLMIDAFKRSSARRITAVIPYFGYSRQDKKVMPRVPISGKLVADVLEKSGANRVITMDLHSSQIQGFFNCPVDNLFAQPEFVNYLLKLKKECKNELMIVSPDAGGTLRARSYAKKLETGLAIVDKRREKPNESEAMSIIGDVSGKTIVIIDDMADTFGTLKAAAKIIMVNKACEVYACCTHPVLSGDAIDNLRESEIKALITTNTIPLSEKATALAKQGKIIVLPVARLFGEAIVRSHEGESVHSLFD